MGGRGSVSSGSNPNSDIYISFKIPSSDEFEFDTDLPSLTGSEKQIKWAEEIRAEALNEMSIYAATRTADGRPSDLYKVAMTEGKEGIIKSIMNNPLIKSTEGAVRKEKIDNEVKAYVELAKRIKRFNQLTKQSSAKFWIDNRPNQLANHSYKAFKKQIDG